MIKILIKLWPAFIPALIFGIWYFRAIARNKKSGDANVYDVFLQKKKKYIYYTLISAAILVILTLLYFALTEPATPRMEFDSQRVENNLNK